MKRVIAKMCITYNYSSDEYTETLIQCLQEKKVLKIFGLKLLS